MTSPNLVLLYVEDPAQSAQFYERLFGRPPVAVFPTYAAFTFDNGLHLGLWSTSARDFVSGGAGHRSELAFMVDDDREVRRLYDAWKALGVPFEQAPMTAVFGLTFVALDPDGHRLRVCTPDD
ncbi:MULTISPECIES: VOC family protein [Burkholderia]|uniref:Glyoxalase n=1 Tax=Burkholderia aenigmatica TaxID=2015348 RepID=A0A228IIL0_9BURK|nr:MULTISPECIES: VOC family protein [Burkholderia]MBN3842896.1 glyoxalase [Burkholderia sp. Ac-20349]MDN7514595.1 VOC family protein [Burkholderia sp. AU45251]MDN7877020.1 VOC family protein [Burkholderia aenigmatica]OXI42263.1 glyoxalase [Burkholderia aenigmatica]HDR9483655.1 VOC family protein [Burkholderia aenigmatica]